MRTIPESQLTVALGFRRTNLLAAISRSSSMRAMKRTALALTGSNNGLPDRQLPDVLSPEASKRQSRTRDQNNTES